MAAEVVFVCCWSKPEVKGVNRALVVKEGTSLESRQLIARGLPRVDPHVYECDSRIQCCRRAINDLSLRAGSASHALFTLRDKR
jgi:hypothetical protein